MKVKSREDLKDRELLVIKTAEGCGENKDKYACIIQLRQDGELGKKDPQKNPNLYTKSYTDKSGNKQYTNTVYLSEAEYKAIEKASEGNGYKTQKSACFAVKCDLKIEEAAMKNASGQPILNDDGKPVTKKKLALDFDTVRPSDYVFDTKSKTVHDINWKTAAKPENIAMYDHLKSMLASYELTPNPYAEKQSEAVSEKETVETEKKQPLQSKREMTFEEYKALNLFNKGTLLGKYYYEHDDGDQCWSNSSHLYQLGDRYFYEGSEGYYCEDSYYEYTQDEAVEKLKEYEEESKRWDSHTVTEAGRQILDGKNAQAEKQSDTVTAEKSKETASVVIEDAQFERLKQEVNDGKRMNFVGTAVCIPSFTIAGQTYAKPGAKVMPLPELYIKSSEMSEHMVYAVDATNLSFDDIRKDCKEFREDLSIPQTLAANVKAGKVPRFDDNRDIEVLRTRLESCAHTNPEEYSAFDDKITEGDAKDYSVMHGKFTMYAFSAEVDEHGRIYVDTIEKSTLHPDELSKDVCKKSFAYRDSEMFLANDANFETKIEKMLSKYDAPEEKSVEVKEADKTADKSTKTEFGVSDCWDEPTPTEAREAKRQANLEEKVKSDDGFDVKDLKGRDVIIIKAAEGCGKDKDGYLVSVTLRQDGEFGANDPHMYPCVSMHDYNGRRGNTVYLTKSQYEAVENAAGDNAFQPKGNRAMHMAVKCDLKERTDETGYKYLTLDTKTVQPPSVEFNEKTLTDHRDTISRNRKDVEKIQSLTKDADKIKSTLNARFASAAQVGSEVSQPESSTPDYPF